MTYSLNSGDYTEIKRLVGQSAPWIKSSHRAEAIARGIGFGTNAALLSALSNDAVIQIETDRASFEAFLEDRGYKIEKLQASLLSDAVRIALGLLPLTSDVESSDLGAFGSGRMPSLRNCLACFDPFFSRGPNNMLCGGCRERGARVPGVQHAGKILGQALRHLLHTGQPQKLDHLRVRPGWSDVLDGEGYKASMEDTLRTRIAVFERRWKDLPEQEQRLIELVGGEAYLRQFSGH